MDEDAFLEAFDAGAISRDAWSHRAHLRVAFLLLRHESFEDVLPRLRAGLTKLLVRFGVEDSLERGYHETITVAWLRLVHSAMRDHGPYASFDALLEQHGYLLDKHLLRAFYTRRRIVSAEAKRSFVDGDLAPLP